MNTPALVHKYGLGQSGNVFRKKAPRLISSGMIRRWTGRGPELSWSPLPHLLPLLLHVHRVGIYTYVYISQSIAPLCSHYRPGCRIDNLLFLRYPDYLKGIHLKTSSGRDWARKDYWLSAL